MSRLCLLLSLSLLLSACGLKGPLSLPNRTQPATVEKQADAPADGSDPNKETKDKPAK